MRLVFLLALLSACEVAQGSTKTALTVGSSTVYIPAASGSLTVGTATRTPEGLWDLGTGSSVAFPIVIKSGEAVVQLTAKVSCRSSGDKAHFKLAQFNTDGDWLNNGPSTDSTSFGNGTQDLVLDMSGYPLAADPNGYRLFSAVVTVTSKSNQIVVYGLEESLQ